jgi:hypothetical protein
MIGPLETRLEPFVVPEGFKGLIADLPLPVLLQHLRQTKATGILSVASGVARKAVYLKGGQVVFASSNQPNDRLGEILLREGKITVREYEASIKAITKGKRQGRVLVEMGALSPKDLWDGVQFYIREVVYSIFKWEEGLFHFEESDLPEKEKITVDLDVRELTVAGLRQVDPAGPIRHRFPDGALVLERVTEDEVGGLEAYEGHVLSIIDGERSVLDVCRESEIGDTETLKALYAFLSAGLVRAKGRKVHTLDQDFVPEDTLYSVINSFNQKYAHVFKYMVGEVGPIAENVLEKYLGGLRQSRADVFADVRLQKDGTLEPALVELNANKLEEEERRSLLVDALNELLYAELLAVKRTLGSDHEASIIKTLLEQP